MNKNTNNTLIQLNSTDKALIQKYTINIQTLIKYKTLIKHYINTFNQTLAYKEVWNPSNHNVAKTEASRIFAKPIVIELLVLELRKLNIVDNWLSKEYIANESIDLLHNTKQDNIKARVLEHMAKIGGLTNDNTVNIAVVNDLNQSTRDKIKARVKAQQSEALDIEEDI